MGKGTYLGGSTIIRLGKGSPPNRREKPLSAKKLPKDLERFLQAIAFGEQPKMTEARRKEIEAAGGLEAWIRRDPARNHAFQFMRQMARPTRKP